MKRTQNHICKKPRKLEKRHFRANPHCWTEPLIDGIGTFGSFEHNAKLARRDPHKANKSYKYGIHPECEETEG